VSASAELPHVVIVGGGFGGLAAARGLRRARVRVTLVDRRNHHLFQPLLYQVATAALAAPDIAAPIRHLLRRQRNATVLLREVRDVDLEARQLVLEDGVLPWDHLIVATGNENTWFGRDAWAADAPGLKSIDDAFDIRHRILGAYEAAEGERDPARLAALMTFVVIGGGPTGVELAGALNEISRRTMRRDFRTYNPAAARVLLVEGGERLLSAFPEGLSDKARAHLVRRGVEVRLQTLATHIDECGVVLRRRGAPDDGSEDERVGAATVLWAAGVRGSPLGGRLGAEVDRAGRVHVTPELHVPGRPDVMVVGDLARVAGADGEPVPGVAPAAIQMGRYAARSVRRRLAGKPPEPFRFVNKGMMATIGRSAAVAWLGRIRFAGFFAWLLWVFVHILYLASFRNRLVVFFQWAWAYFTWNRPGRIILERVPRRLAATPRAPPRAGEAARPAADGPEAAVPDPGGPPPAAGSPPG